MNPQKPRSEGFDGVCIGIPVAPGYAIPPHQPSSTSNSHAAAQGSPTSSSNSHAATQGSPTSSLNDAAGINSTSESCIDKKSFFAAHNICSVFLTVIIMVGLIYLIPEWYKYPSFKVEWAMVNVHQSNNNSSSAIWNVGLSVDEGWSYDSFDYQSGMDVLFRSMSEDWTRAHVVESYNQDSTNTTSLIAFVSTSLPRHNPPGSILQGLTLDFEVMIGIKYARGILEANCRNMTVGFLSSAARGVMRGPRLCDAKYHNYS